MTSTIVFDFDGTIALGSGPIEAYARAVGAAVGDPAFTTRALADLAAFEAGDSDARDGYDVVARLAAEREVPATRMQAAYQASREVLGSADAAVQAPDGLADFLARVGAHARLVLATNAPGEGIAGLLEAWGVVGAFDQLNFSVGKPGGLVPIITEALTRGPVLSVGDIVEFDLAPAMELGAATALVGATWTRSAADVTMRGRTLADLYGDIETWAATAAASTPEHTTP